MDDIHTSDEDAAGAGAPPRFKLTVFHAFGCVVAPGREGGRWTVAGSAGEGQCTRVKEMVRKGGDA